VTHWSPLDDRSVGGNNETVIALPEPLASKPQFIPPLFLYLIQSITFIYVLPIAEKWLYEPLPLCNLY
jgi:hypothetical protein